jgi:endonuclease-3
MTTRTKRRPRLRTDGRRGRAARTASVRPARRAGHRDPSRSFRPTPALAVRILDLLELAHPEATCALHYRNAYELLVATILSAQCTDQRVNLVTPALFRRYPTPHALAGAQPPELEGLIRSTGFFRAKAKSLIGCARALVEHHGGELPRSVEAMVKLPGVGRKTASVVLGHAYGIAEGIAVDTHVLRVSRRLGLARADDALKVERELMRLVPRERWTRTTDLLIFHGRKICDARKPACGVCPLFGLCRWESRLAFASLPTPRRGP